jgi:transposase
MSVQIEALFTSAAGLQPPWAVRDVRLHSARHRIDFDVQCQQSQLACPACGAPSPKIHDRLPRSWRHPDSFQYEAWLHADVPCVGCKSCGKTTQINAPWAREGCGFTLPFEALALMLAGAAVIRHHFDGIVAWVQTRQTNGFLDVFTNLFQARRARGFASFDSPGTVIVLIAGKLDFVAVNPQAR